MSPVTSQVSVEPVLVMLPGDQVAEVEVVASVK